MKLFIIKSYVHSVGGAAYSFEKDDAYACHSDFKTAHRNVVRVR